MRLAPILWLTLIGSTLMLGFGLLLDYLADAHTEAVIEASKRGAPPPGMLPLVAVCLGALLIMLVIIVLSLRWIWRPQTLRALASMGYEVCPRCGYWLRGLPEGEDRCPECGAKREPMPEAGDRADPD